jgi:hypothetical protein
MANVPQCTDFIPIPSGIEPVRCVWLIEVGKPCSNEPLNPLNYGITNSKTVVVRWW